MSTRDTGNPSSRGTLALACCLTVAVGASASSGGGASAARSAALRPVASHATPGVPRAVIAPVSFRNQVIPVLTKAGCNSGACHGAAAGKNGFGLTLRGYDPLADYDTITRQAGGRRVNKMEPGKSLILLKPTETVPHMGGTRFKVGSPEYDIISHWIASGFPAPRDSDPRLKSLDVSPQDRTLDAGATLPLRVTAHFTDGSSADVTRWAKYGSADETVAHVEDDGQVSIKGSGETAVSVSFLTGVALARVRSPYPVSVPDTAFTKPAGAGVIDDLVLGKLRELHIAPAPVCTDSEFIRRAYLDAAGILPTRREVESFLADTAPNKRALLVDRLLERDEFVDYWAYKWSDVLLVSSRALGKNNVRDFYELDSHGGDPEHAVGQVRLRADHGGRPYRRKRRGELLPDSSQSDRPRRKLHAGVPRADADLRTLPQPPHGEVDAGRLLRLREPVRARFRERGRVDGR